MVMITEVYKVQKMIPMVRHFPQTPSVGVLSTELRWLKTIYLILLTFLVMPTVLWLYSGDFFPNAEKYIFYFFSLFVHFPLDKHDKHDYLVTNIRSELTI